MFKAQPQLTLSTFSLVDDFLLPHKVLSTVSREEAMNLLHSLHVQSVVLQSDSRSDSDNISESFVALQETPLHDVTSSSFGR